MFFNETDDANLKKLKSPYNHIKQIKMEDAPQGYFWDASESWVSALFPERGFLLKHLCIRFEIISNLLIGGKNLAFLTAERNSERDRERGCKGKEGDGWTTGIRGLGDSLSLAT